MRGLRQPGRWLRGAGFRRRSMQIGMRRCLRVLYLLVAVGALAALPVLIVDFRNHDWSVHYKVLPPSIPPLLPLPPHPPPPPRPTPFAAAAAAANRQTPQIGCHSLAPCGR